MSELQKKIEHYNYKVKTLLQQLHQKWPANGWAIEEIYKKMEQKDGIEDFATLNLSASRKHRYEYFYEKYCDYWAKTIKNNVIIRDSDPFWKAIASLLIILYHQLDNSLLI